MHHRRGRRRQPLAIDDARQTNRASFGVAIVAARVRRRATCTSVPATRSRGAGRQAHEKLARDDSALAATTAPVPDASRTRGEPGSRRCATRSG